jgi:hypothetical protein
MGEKTAPTLLRLRAGFRVIVLMTWLLIIAVTLFLPRTGTKAVAMTAFWWFRAIAVLGAVYLIYEVSQVTERRLGVGGVILDALLVLPMFLFWFAAMAASF